MQIIEATKTGLIQYDDDSTPMGGAEGGLIGTFGAASFCPNQPEEFRVLYIHFVLYLYMLKNIYKC